MFVRQGGNWLSPTHSRATAMCINDPRTIANHPTSKRHPSVRVAHPCRPIRSSLSSWLPRLQSSARTIDWSSNDRSFRAKKKARRGWSSRRAVPRSSKETGQIEGMSRERSVASFSPHVTYRQSEARGDAATSRTEIRAARGSIASRKASASRYEAPTVENSNTPGITSNRAAAG